MERSRNNLQGVLILAALITLGGLYLWRNNQPAVTVLIPAATSTPVNQPADWETALEAQLAAAGTPLPTPDLGTQYVPPTLPPTEEQPEAPVIYQPADIEITPRPSPTAQPTLPPPTQFGPTPFPSPTGLAAAAAEREEALDYQPPQMQGQPSAHVNDHYWLDRPIDAKANSASLFYYTFGSNGPNDEWRVHHGVDMSNPTGQPIHAAGTGTVIIAGDGGEIIDRTLGDIYPAYGNVVVIKHNFSYRGQPIYTLYAHMARILIEEGAHVEAGTILGLSGSTGDVSGPHVHMEVRVGQNKYFDVHNPLLWIKPWIGHGVIAGRVADENGAFLDDLLVTLTQNGRVVQTTTTYIRPKKSSDQEYGDWDVVPDSAWNENFVIADVPAGEYQLSVDVAGRNIRRSITVVAGTTNFIELSLGPAATPQPVSDETDE